MKSFIASAICAVLLGSAQGQEAAAPLTLEKTIPLEKVEGRIDHLAADVAVGLLLLEEPPENGEDRASYWIAYPNFYVITRYNKSRLYAATVFALAQSIKDAYAAAR